MHSFIRQKKLARCVWWPPPVIPVSRTEAGGSLQVPGQLRPHLETPSNKQSPNQTKPKNQGRNDQAQMDARHSGSRLSPRLYSPHIQPPGLRPASLPRLLSPCFGPLLFLASPTYSLFQAPVSRSFPPPGPALQCFFVQRDHLGMQKASFVHPTRNPSLVLASSGVRPCLVLGMLRRSEPHF